MNGLDILIILFLIGSAVYGFRQGFVRQVGGWLSWGLAIVVAVRFSDVIGARLSTVGLPADLDPLALFFLVALVTLIVSKLAVALLQWVFVRNTWIAAFNSAAGAMVGIVAAGLLIGVGAWLATWNVGSPRVAQALERSQIATQLSRMVQYPAEMAAAGQER